MDLGKFLMWVVMFIILIVVTVGIITPMSWVDPLARVMLAFFIVSLGLVVCILSAAKVRM